MYSALEDLDRRDQPIRVSLVGAGSMGVGIAWQLGRKLTFDPVKEEFIGDVDANRMRCRALRQPWHA